MAQLRGFDAEQVAPREAFDTIPSGWYVAHITGSESKQAKSGKGEYIKLEFTVLEGQYVNRKVWANLNLFHENQQAVEIAEQDLSAICHAVGVMRPQDTQELHEKPLQIKVSIRQSEGYEPQNEVKGYKPVGTSRPTSAPTQQASSTGTTPPWRQGTAA